MRKFIFPDLTSCHTQAAKLHIMEGLHILFRCLLRADAVDKSEEQGLSPNRFDQSWNYTTIHTLNIILT